MTMLYIYIVTAILYCSSNVLAQTTTTQLQNNQILSNSIAASGYNYYYFSIPAQSQVFSKRAIPNIYLSTSTCSQPTPPSTFHDVVPSINMYISLSNDNTLPGPDNGIAVDDALNGLTSWTSNYTASEIWIAVGATSLPNTWTGNWTYEIGVSTNRKKLIYVYKKEKAYTNIYLLFRNDASYIY
jgi:calcium channel MID1